MSVLFPHNPQAEQWFLECCQKLGFQLKVGGQAKRLRGYFKPEVQVVGFRKKKSGLIRLFDDEVLDRLLLTAIHELAHGVVWLDYPASSKIKAHGPEWQNTFQDLLTYALQSHFFSAQAEPFIVRHIQQGVSASSGTDIQLEEYFMQQEASTALLLKQLPMGCLFEFEGMVFQKGRKLKKRFECTEVQSNRLYRIHPLARVEQVS